MEISKVLYISRSYQDLCERKEPLVEISKVLYISHSYQDPCEKSFSFSISPSNEHPGLISFRMDWLDLLAVQGTVKSLLQHHSSKA